LAQSQNEGSLKKRIIEANKVYSQGRPTTTNDGNITSRIDENLGLTDLILERRQPIISIMPLSKGGLKKAAKFIESRVGLPRRRIFP